MIGIILKCLCMYLLVTICGGIGTPFGINSAGNFFLPSIPNVMFPKIAPKTCISKCTTNKLICRIADCDESFVYTTNGTFPSAPTITSQPVQWYTYLGSDDYYNLALNFSWMHQDLSPEVKGYRIQLKEKDNVTSEICFQFFGNISMKDLVKKTFYYDCFGFSGETKLEPNKTYEVVINSLPIRRNLSKSAVTKIRTPDCQDFTEQTTVRTCNAEQQCTKDCSTTSKDSESDETWPIECSIPAKCDLKAAVNGNGGTPSAPTRVKKDHEWYTFYDPYDGTARLGLNFSWSPQNDGSIVHLRGYRLEVVDLGVASTRTYDVCYNISTPMEYQKHIHAEFYHDCYGKHTFPVTVDRTYRVHINSIPLPQMRQDDLYLSFIIRTPTCDDPRLSNLKECEEKEQITGQVDEIFCFNKTVKFTYNVPSVYGEYAFVGFCEYSVNRLRPCEELFVSMDRLALSATLYNLTLDPPTRNLSQKYFILIYGNGDAANRLYTPPFNFSECIETSPPDVYQFPHYLIAVIVIISVFAIAFVIIIVWLTCYKRSPLTTVIRNPMSKQNNGIINGNYQFINGNGSTKSGQSLTKSNYEITENFLPGGSNTRVFVIYTNDHELHQNVILWFCTFLKNDLNLDVHTYLWQKTMADSNPIAWVKDNLQKADKVIILCSEGCKHSLQKSDNVNDQFRPIVQMIINDKFLTPNPKKQKHLVAHFDYSPPHVIPDMLADGKCNQYKLMDQFQDFYLRILDQDYTSGQVNFDHYFTNCVNGKNLKNSIESMAQFVVKNPTWFSDEHGSDLPASNLQQIPKEQEIKQGARKKIVLSKPNDLELTDSLGNSLSNSTPSSLNEDVFDDNLSYENEYSQQPILTNRNALCDNQNYSEQPLNNSNHLNNPDLETVQDVPTIKQTTSAHTKIGSQVSNVTKSPEKSPISSVVDSGLFDMDFDTNGHSVSSENIDNSNLEKINADKTVPLNSKYENPKIPLAPQESGYFTLTPLDELDEDNIEDAISSINMLQC